MRQERGGRIGVIDAGGSVVTPDTVVLLSTGIDIGSATTQMLLSRLTMKRIASNATPVIG